MFWRTSGSGARAKVRAKSDKDTASSYGDMTFIHSMGEPLVALCTFEFKKGYNKDLSLLSLLDSRGSKQILRKFLKQVIEDSRNAGTYPILEVHRDYRLPVLFLSRGLYWDIKAFCGEPWFETIVLKISEGNFVALKRSDFFDWCTPEYFKDQFHGRGLK